jgi:fucose permease
MRIPPQRAVLVLHPVFALTGVVQAMGGPLLPSIAARFHLVDRQSGVLFLLYFAGTSLGAIVCRRDYVLSLRMSFLLMAAAGLGISVAARPLLPVLFFLFGISNGVPMTAVNLYVGHHFQERCAPVLTFLNFSWSIGALVAPLVAASVLLHYNYATAYRLLACAALIAAAACTFLEAEPATLPIPPATPGSARVRLLLLFAGAAFLQVGIENTATTWLASFLLRATGSGAAEAAAASSLYFIGFLASRGLSSLLLLRARGERMLGVAVLVALVASLLLFVLPTPAARGASMLLLGAALAPIYPIVIALFFARTPRAGDTRWILATAGVGGSVLPWLAGWISSSTGSLRVGMLTIPAALATMALLLPAMSGPASGEKCAKTATA